MYVKQSMPLLSLIIMQSALHCFSENLFIDQLRTYITPDEIVVRDITAIPAQLDKVIPLFKAYPALNAQLPYISLGAFPTPITHAQSAGKTFAIPNLYIKRDDLSGRHSHASGGNKVRKLEFLLADAVAHKARTVLTFGCFGSNHAAATSYYAKQLGLRSIAVLSPQKASQVVRKNLLLMHYNDAHMVFCPNGAGRKQGALAACIEHKKNYGEYPYIIPTGGSCPLGAIGFVNAAFELREQINQGLMPEPDLLYVAAGSFGTIAGLLLGIKAAGLKTTVVGICVEPEAKEGTFIQRVQKLFEETNTLLSNLDPLFPRYAFPTDESFRLIYKFAGDGYGIFTLEGMFSKQMFNLTEQIILDGTYTGKAFNGAICEVQQSNWHDKTVLLWHTFWTDTSIQASRPLPTELQELLRLPLQPLDNSLPATIAR